MNLRARLIGVVALLTVASLGGAFASVATVGRTAPSSGSSTRRCGRGARGGPRDRRARRRRAGHQRPARPRGQRRRAAYQVRRDLRARGRVLAATASFGGDVPPLARVSAPAMGDLRPAAGGPSTCAGVFAPVPGHPGDDACCSPRRGPTSTATSVFLARAMTMAFVAGRRRGRWRSRRGSCAASTREYDAVAEAVRRVADGDLEARASRAAGAARSCSRQRR